MTKPHSDLYKRHPSIEIISEQIENATNAMADCYRTGGKVYIMGNGGSAADAEHFAGELNKGFLSKRRLTEADSSLLNKINPEIAKNLQGSLPTIPLTGFLSTITAFQNDCDPDFYLAQLIWSLATPIDVVIGISTSGNSRNILLGMQVAKAKQCKTILLTGQNVGECVKYSDIAVHAPEKHVHYIQELHLPIYHSICLELENLFFPL